MDADAAGTAAAEAPDAKVLPVGIPGIPIPIPSPVVAVGAAGDARPLLPVLLAASGRLAKSPPLPNAPLDSPGGRVPVRVAEVGIGDVAPVFGVAAPNPIAQEELMAELVLAGGLLGSPAR